MEAREGTARGWAPPLLLTAVSTIGWMVLLPAARESGPLGPYVLGVLIVTFLVARAFAMTPRVAGVAAVIGPMLLASRTVWRGDEDGLWSLIYPMLAGFGLLAATVAAAAGRRTGARLDPRSIVVVAVTAVAVVAAVATTYVRLPQRAFDARTAPLRAVAASIPTPIGFEDRGVSTSGRPLNSNDPHPTAHRVFQTLLTSSDACPRFEAALRRSAIGPLTDHGDCRFTGARPGMRVTAELRLGSTWSEAIVRIEEA